MPRPQNEVYVLGASTTMLSKDDEYAFMCGSIFYETDVIIKCKKSFASK